MDWPTQERAWQDELVDKLPSSIDKGQLERSLRMTVTERLEQIRKMGELVEEMRRGRDRLPRTP
jgi:hypothetical protein